MDGLAGLMTDPNFTTGGVHTDTTNTIKGGAGDDRLVGTDQGDRIVGLGGDDILIGGLGYNVLIGGAGRDTASYAHAQAGGVSVDLTTGLAYNLVGESGFFDELHSIENVIGSAGNDGITGDAKANRLYGGGGDDFLDSGGGGRDTMQGGRGQDVAMFLSSDVGVSVDLRIAGAQNIGSAVVELSSIEGLIGSYQADQLTGDDGVNRLLGQNGDDVLSGLGGADSIDGGLGSNTLNGGAGDDLLIVGGADDLTGGDGADLFKLTSLTGAGSVIHDLDSSDVIDLKDIDADVTQRHNQKFVLVEAFGGHAGEAVLDVSDGTTYFRLDVDGDAQADAVLTIEGDHGDFTNFVL